MVFDWFDPLKHIETDTKARNINKVRIVALYIQYRDGVPDEDRRRLYQHARLTLAEQDAVNALVHMGVRISRVRLADVLQPGGRAEDFPRDREIKIGRIGSSKRQATRRSMNSQGISRRSGHCLRSNYA